MCAKSANGKSLLYTVGPPLKLSERVIRVSPLQTLPIEQLLTSLSLGVQKGLDPDANNLVAAGTFVHGSMYNPGKVSRLM